jgi:hypothetical protein
VPLVLFTKFRLWTSPPVPISALIANACFTVSVAFLNDPDSITYHNRCNFCDTKFSKSQHQLPPHQVVIPSQIPAPQNCEFPTIQVATSSIRTTTPTSQLLFSGTPITNSQLLTRTPITTSVVLDSALNRDLTIFQGNSYSQLDDINDDLLSETDIVDSLIPSWFHLDISEIYDHLNPATKKGQNDQRTWRKCAIDINGKPITSVGVIANRLLKILTGKKFQPDTPLNSKLQSKKVERQQQLQDFLTMGSNPPAVIIVQKFLTENICMPVNADGNVIDVDSIPINVGARVIMLAVEPDS